MAHTDMRERAREMRANGASIRAISNILNSSKSTISYWCRNIALTKQQVVRLGRNRTNGGIIGRLRAAEMKRAKRLVETKREQARGAGSVRALSRRDLFMIGTALYWGEGYKSGNEECGLTNSNPDIIRAHIKWLFEIHGVKPEDLILRVSINETHAYRQKEVEKYWSRETKIPLSQFTKTSLIRVKAKKIYGNTNLHFGTLRVKVRRATALRRRILGTIAEIARQLERRND